MIAALLESLSSQISARWLERFLGPAWLFWVGGALLTIQRMDYSLAELWASFAQLDALLQGALLIGGLLLIGASDALLDSLDLPLLRLLEGYWLNSPLRWLVGWGTRVQGRKYQAWLNRWQTLKAKPTLSPAESQELEYLEEEIRTYPADPQRFLPTRLGNLVRSAEEAPRERFGLDAVTCWPYLWFVLPDSVRQEILQARHQLNRSAQSLVWGALFLLWTLASAWAIPIGLVWMVWAYRRTFRMARVFGELLEAAFGLYRWELYHSQRWPLPKDPEEELALGRRLSEFLARGTTEEPVTYRD